MFRHYLRLCAIFSMLATAVACHAGNAPAFPSPSADASLAAGKGEQTAVVAGGCFWGVQAVFQHVKGVISATSGYAGGEAGTAHYDRVSDGNTGHAESVKIIYDPSQITYGQLLRVFFYVAHDPTELNRQGPDEGTQYRSVIFYASDEQKQIAEAYVAQLNAAKEGAIRGLAAAAAGLVAATAARMAEPLLRRRFLAAAPFIVAAFAAVGVAKLPLPYVMLVLAPLSVALAWRRPA